MQSVSNNITQSPALNFFQYFNFQAIGKIILNFKNNKQCIHMYNFTSVIKL